jgi:hypothetical protein
MNAKCGEPRRARAATGEIQRAAGNEWSWSTSKAERASDAAEASVVLQILGLQASLDGSVERSKHSGGENRRAAEGDLASTEEVAATTLSDSCRVAVGGYRS